MRKLLCLLAFVLPFLANAMKVEKNEIDEFTGQRTVITSWEHSAKRQINIRFRLQNGYTYLDFKFSCGTAIVIGEGSDLLFKSTTDNVGKFVSTSIFHGGKGEGAVGMNMSGVWGIMATYTGDLSWFKDNITRLIRVYATDGYYDRTISEKEGEKYERLYDLFMSAVSESPK